LAKKNYVIIGNGAAGLSAAEAVRDLDQKVRVTLIAEEPHAVYSKVLLHHYVGGEIEESGLFIRPASHYGKIQIEPLFGSKVEKVFPKEHSILLQGGLKIGYDRLLLATGSLPWKPSIPGVNLDGVYSLWTLEDARKIRSALQGTKRAVVLGSSFLGMQVLDALSRLPLERAVVDIADQIMPGRLDRTASLLMQDHLEEKGVQLFLGVRPVEIQSFGRSQKALVLADGRTLVADMIIVATGSKPNTGMIEDGGRAIVVDDTLRSDYEDVYAAGDAAETYNCLTGGRKAFGLWTAAVDQGRIAGLNMAGRASVYRGGFDMNATHVLGVPIITFGHPVSPADGTGWEETTDIEPSKKCYRKFTYFMGKPMGAILIGRVKDAGIVGQWIRRANEVAEEEKPRDWAFPRFRPQYVKDVMESSCCH